MTGFSICHSFLDSYIYGVYIVSHKSKIHHCSNTIFAYVHACSIIYMVNHIVK
jgi:hypothetical protein